MKEPGPIAKKAVETARGFIGTREEGGNNDGPQIDRFLASTGIYEPSAWCMAFCYHCLLKSAGFLGKKLPEGFPKTAYCPTMQAWAKREGLWIPATAEGYELARPGDLALFYFPTMGRVAHVGFLEKKGARLGTIEGNTSPKNGIDRDGDVVTDKKRSLSALGGSRGGFVRLPF